MNKERKEELLKQMKYITVREKEIMKFVCKICKVDRTREAGQVMTNDLIKCGLTIYNSKGELETYKEIKKCKCNK